MSRPLLYDPNSPNEQAVALPSAPLVTLAKGLVLQPPLTRRGTGPGLIAFLPPDSALDLSRGENLALDPAPVEKWAEEGFAVVGITTGHRSVQDNLKKAVGALLDLKELDTRDKFAVAVYDATVLAEVVSALSQDARFVCLVVYGYPLTAPATSTVPTLIFLPSGSAVVPSAPNLTVFKVDSPSPSFPLPQTVDFHTGAASISHSKAAAHLRKYLGGPFFDLEAIWEEHTYFEFEIRSVAKTMGTMVAEPYVNHVPTLAGGIGRKQLSEFYRDHFIFSNPKDTRMQSISRTVGSDRVVDEFIFHATHDKQIDWLLPGVPPTGKKLSIPMLGVINIRGDRLYHEHIWWDQGTACMQAGIIPTHISFDGRTLRLPIAGVESATLLLDERSVPPNEMLGPTYGFKDA
ncbi:NTF2-like protein [Mycena galericulata]|nr:NTF2-like protein [Mycena galericulata]